MRNRMTFANVIGILLENSNKTYPQHLLIRNLFSECLDDTLPASEILDGERIEYSRWCTGARPVTVAIINSYEPDNWDTMEDDFRDKILPNLLNPINARAQMEKLITDCTNTIGQAVADALLSYTDDAEFYTMVIRYAILNNHHNGNLYSPDLSDTLLSCRVPSHTKEFVGRKAELKDAYNKLSSNSPLFITGIPGIGKSEFAKTFAEKYRSKYTNIIFLHYAGSLKKCVAGMEFDTDNSQMDAEALFQTHYDVLKTLHSDSLIILDNFNVLPKDDGWMKEFLKNDFQLMVTTRCRITSFETLEIKELEKEKELTDLFYRHCPSAKSESDTVKQIIEVLHAHTLTVCLAALVINASGIEPEELLQELNTCGLNADISEEVELYKDEEFDQALLIEHLRKLLQFNHLNNTEHDILRNISLFPVSGVRKRSVRSWLQLKNLNNVNHMIQYGFVTEDTENKTISLHPLIQQMALLETMPSTTNCTTLLHTLHGICLVHGLDIRRPEEVLSTLVSINERIIVDAPEDYLLLLQDEFPYFEKYGVTDALTDLVNRMEYIMQEHKVGEPRSKALLLDYKAELFYLRKDYANALKRRKKALDMITPMLTDDTDIQLVSLASNLHNNLANCYLANKDLLNATAEMEKALSIRKEYESFGTMENHDVLQQMGNLVSLLIQAKDYNHATALLDFYEQTVMEHEGSDTFDYGYCQFQRGLLALSTGKATIAENHLLLAESIFINTVGVNHEYTKGIYAYLNLLYQKWKKPELAEKYKQKYIDVGK